MKGKETMPFAGMKIFFSGVGGQGTLLATRLVGEAALAQGLPVMMSEIHGMAQRGGVVESSIVVGDIAAPTIADGEADVLMAFEALEALRALRKCHSQTHVIMNTGAIVPFTVASGQGVYPTLETIQEFIDDHVGELIILPASSLAKRAGTERAANMVVVGALAGRGLLPISKMVWLESMRRLLPGKLHKVNEQAFEMGFQQAQCA